MQILEIGKPFELFYGRNMEGQSGCIFECHKTGGYALIVYMDNMTEAEKKLLRFGKIQVKIIKETDSFMLTLIKFANSPLVFEMEFDPTLYKDNRMDNMLKSNIIDIIGVESTDNTIQTIRQVSTPMNLYRIWLVAWQVAKETNNFSEKYKRWVDDLRKRYSVLQLWDIGSYIGKMGE